MAMLLAFAAAVNINDPDPVQWVVLYGAACVASVVAAVTGTVPIAVPSAIAIIAFIWGILIARRVPNLEAYTKMFDEWEMKSTTVEEAREACGLFIVAAWMIAVVVRLR
jgi:hypothetical protein